MEREEEASLRQERAAQPRTTIKLNRHSTPEEIALFRQAVRSESEILAERVEARTEGEWTAREERMARDLQRLWRDASWIQTLHQFPNGRPLQEQQGIKLTIWAIFMDAMNKRANGVKPDADEDRPEAR